MILSSSDLELDVKNKKIMNILIIDAAEKEIFLSLIINKKIYTSRHKNSKSNFEKLTILISELLEKKIQIAELNKIYVNRGPGSFAGIRNSLSIVKGFYLVNNIDYYCYSYKDFNKFNVVNHQDVVDLCDKFKIKKNLINPLYLS